MDISHDIDEEMDLNSEKYDVEIKIPEVNSYNDLNLKCA